MFENLGYFFRRMVKQDQKELGSKDAAKERLHLVLMQDRANVSADFLELMKQEIIDVIKKYIVVDESSIDVRLTNQSNDDGTTGAPSLYANIPIVNIKNDMMAEKVKEFEGVDFNKEMGLDSSESEAVEEAVEAEEVKEEKVEPLELETVTSEELEENKTAIIENLSEDSEEDLEDDDDVTFDDLLKAAEEEEKNKEVEENKEEKVEKPKRGRKKKTAKKEDE